MRIFAYFPDPSDENPLFVRSPSRQEAYRKVLDAYPQALGKVGDRLVECHWDEDGILNTPDPLETQS